MRISAARTTRLLLFGLAASLVFPGSALAQAGGAQTQEEVVVQPGDRLQIEMFTAAGQALVEVTGTRTIDRSGQIFLPYVGSVEVSGLGPTQIRELLFDLYSSFYANPVIDVEAEIRINITGAVASPGNYFLPPTSTIIDALATAGGAAAEVDLGVGRGGAADLERVRLVRDNDVRILNLSPDQDNIEVLNLLIQSGDWLHIPPLSSSRWRANLQLTSQILSVIGSIAALIVLAR